MKTTLDLPDALVNDVKLRALNEGRDFNDAAADFLRRGLAACEPQAAPRPTITINPQSGFLSLECPADAPARRMTISELVALEHETLAREDSERIGLSPRQ